MKILVRNAALVAATHELSKAPALVTEAEELFNLENAVEGHKALQVLVVKGASARRRLTDLELLRSRANRPESLSSASDPWFSTGSNCRI